MLEKNFNKVCKTGELDEIKEFFKNNIAEPKLIENYWKGFLIFDILTDIFFYKKEVLGENFSLKSYMDFINYDRLNNNNEEIDNKSLEKLNEIFCDEKIPEKYKDKLNVYMGILPRGKEEKENNTLNHSCYWIHFLSVASLRNILKENFDH